MSITNDLSRLANNANVIINSITVNSTAITSVNVAGITINSSGYTGDANNAAYLGGSSLSTIQGQITSNASAAYSNSVIYTDTKIGTANSAITGNAATAYSNAVSYTDTKIGTANSAIVANASAAYANAVSYVDTKIGTANSAITGNAATAYTNAVSYTDTKIGTANSAIVANASAAYTNATVFASNATNVNTGTLAEARLPYRMNQNVRNTDTVEFGGMTLTGNLVVSGNVNIIGANNLSVSDNMIYLNSNNDVTNPDIGIAGNYNDGSYAHTGIFRDATDGIWKIFDSYIPEPDASVYIDTSNTSFHLANFQANNFYGGNTTANWFVANTSGAYTTGTINAASHTVGTTFTANSTLVNAYALVVATNTATIGTAAYHVANGNFGIGTSSPGTKLDVNGSIRCPTDTSAGYFDIGSFGSYIGRQASDGSTIFNYAQAHLYFKFGGTNTVMFAANGNVGVGTTAPSGKLSVISGSTYFHIAPDTYTSWVVGPRPANDGYCSVIMGYDTNGSGNFWKFDTSSGATSLTQSVAGVQTTKMCWSSNGNVGIGTTSPGYRLDVVGGIARVASNTMIGSHPSYGSTYSAFWREGSDYTVLSDGTNAYFNANSGNVFFRIGNTNKGYFSGSAFYTPFIYDMDNTAYYVDPASTSLFNVVNISAGTSQPLKLTTSSAGPWALELYRSDTNFSVKTYNDGAGWYFTPYITGASSVRAPIFYDSDNTGYYLDPASTSNINTLSVGTISSNYTSTGRVTFSSSQSVGSFQTSTGSLGGIELYGGGGTNAAFMCFHRPGAFAAYFGLDNDNQFAIGGWSYGAGLGDFKCRSVGVGTTASGTSGEIRATNAITSYYSDIRLKTDINIINNALDKLEQLSGFFYKNNDIAKSFGFDSDIINVGVSAQDVQKVLPQAVKPAPFDVKTVDGIDVSISGENYLTVQYERIVPLLIEAIKELRQEVKMLKGE